MRILALLLYIFFFLSALLIALLIFFYVFNTVLGTTSTAVIDIANRSGVSIDISNVDIISPLQPFLLMASYALIVGLVAALISVFLHSRRR